MSQKFLDQKGVQILWEAVKDKTPLRDNYFNYSNDFIPKSGQVCFVDTAQDGLQIKVGDGSTTWEHLEYLKASDSQSGLIKLYTTLGNNVDGSVTQKAITEKLNEKVGVSLDSENEAIIFVTA